MNDRPTTSTLRRIVAMTAAFLVMPAAFSAGDDEALRGELAAVIRSAIPERGALHVQLCDSFMGGRDLYVGFDYETGAYYKVFSTYAGGTDTRGRAFAGEPGAGRIKPADESEARFGRGGISGFVPGVIAWEFARDPQLMTEVWKETEGYRVRRVAQHGANYPRPLPEGFSAPIVRVTYHFNARGLLLKMDEETLPSGPFTAKSRTVALDTTDEVYARYGADRDGASDQWRLVSFRFDEKARPADFTLEGVEELAIKSDVAGVQAELSRPPKLTARRDYESPPARTFTPEQAAEAVSSAPPRLWQRTWRWWAAGGGVAIIALALWLKRRTA